MAQMSASESSVSSSYDVQRPWPDPESADFGVFDADMLYAYEQLYPKEATEKDIERVYKEVEKLNTQNAPKEEAHDRQIGSEVNRAVKQGLAERKELEERDYYQGMLAALAMTNCSYEEIMQAVQNQDSATATAILSTAQGHFSERIAAVDAMTLGAESQQKVFQKLVDAFKEGQETNPDIFQSMKQFADICTFTTRSDVLRNYKKTKQSRSRDKFEELKKQEVKARLGKFQPQRKKLHRKNTMQEYAAVWRYTDRRLAELQHQDSALGARIDRGKITLTSQEQQQYESYLSRLSEAERDSMTPYRFLAELRRNLRVTMDRERVVYHSLPKYYKLDSGAISRLKPQIRQKRQEQMSQQQPTTQVGAGTTSVLSPPKPATLVGAQGADYTTQSQQYQRSNLHSMDTQMSSEMTSARDALVEQNKQSIAQQQARQEKELESQQNTDLKR